jgi:hypothetical protein
MQRGAFHFLNEFVLLPLLHTLVEERAAPQAVHTICCSVLGERRFIRRVPLSLSLSPPSGAREHNPTISKVITRK